MKFYLEKTLEIKMKDKIVMLVYVYVNKGRNK